MIFYRIWRNTEVYVIAKALGLFEVVVVVVVVVEAGVTCGSPGHRGIEVRRGV